MFSKTDYSEKELELFKIFGVYTLVEKVDPYTIYRIAAKTCFIDNRQDSATESLRRCILAWKTCSCYRMTKEWDEMIQL